MHECRYFSWSTEILVDLLNNSVDLLKYREITHHWSAITEWSRLQSVTEWSRQYHQTIMLMLLRRKQIEDLIFINNISTQFFSWKTSVTLLVFLITTNVLLFNKISGQILSHYDFALKFFNTSSSSLLQPTIDGKLQSKHSARIKRMDSIFHIRARQVENL